MCCAGWRGAFRPVYGKRTEQSAIRLLRMAAEILRLNLSPERLLLNPKEKVMLLHRLAKTAAMFLIPHSAPKKVI